MSCAKRPLSPGAWLQPDQLLPWSTLCARQLAVRAKRLAGLVGSTASPAACSASGSSDQVQLRPASVLVMRRVPARARVHLARLHRLVVGAGLGGKVLHEVRRVRQVGLGQQRCVVTPLVSTAATAAATAAAAAAAGTGACAPRRHLGPCGRVHQSEAQARRLGARAGQAHVVERTAAAWQVAADEVVPAIVRGVPVRLVEHDELARGPHARAAAALAAGA
eukprot:scaffold36353_cov64-Phaeocystis_antarctica.AAC.1